MSGEAFGLTDFAVLATGDEPVDPIVNPQSVYSAASNGQLNGSYNYWARIYVRQDGTEAANNRTRFYFEARLEMSGGGAYNNTEQQYWAVYVNGGLLANGHFVLDYNSRHQTSRLLRSGTFWMSHDSNGYRGGFPTELWIDTGHPSVGDGWSGQAWVDADRIAKVPGKPPRPTFRSVATTEVQYNFTAPSDNGGSGITTYNHQSATNSAFTANVQNWDDPGSPAIAANLIPGSNHYFRYRARNAVGAGPWSDTLSQVTMPAVPPGMFVEPNPAGDSAAVLFDPPGGVTGVTGYTWDRRVQGGDGTVVTDDLGPELQTVRNLIPGTIYEWRGAAIVGSYKSPYTGWMAVEQPNPNTQPGNYFDGDTADKPDIDYAWTGTAENSTSTATGKKLVGWTASFNGGSAGNISQVSDDDVSGQYVARVQITADAVAAGNVNAGLSSARMPQVVATGTYYGTMHVKVSRPQRMRAYMIWYDAAGIEVAGRPYGESELLQPGRWYRLMVSGTAPAGTTGAIVRVHDAEGDGWSPWLGGEAFRMDAAAINLGEPFPYFDGNTPDVGEWDFQWEGAPNESASSARPREAVYDPLNDPDCPRPPAPPRPPAITDDCIVSTGTWSRYWAVIPDDYVTEWLSMVPTIALHIGDAPARQVRIRIYPNPLDQPPETFVGDWISEQIVSYMPPNSSLLIDGVDQRVWAEVSAGPRLRADHLLYGTNGEPATWPVLSCGLAYLASFDVPVDAPPVEVEIALTQRRSA